MQYTALAAIYDHATGCTILVHTVRREGGETSYEFTVLDGQSDHLIDVHRTVEVPIKKG